MFLVFSLNLFFFFFALSSQVFTYHKFSLSNTKTTKNLCMIGSYLCWGNVFNQPILFCEEFSSSSVHIGSKAGPVIKYHHKAPKDIKYRSVDLKWKEGAIVHKTESLCGFRVCFPGLPRRFLSFPQEC